MRNRFRSGRLDKRAIGDIVLVLFSDGIEILLRDCSVKVAAANHPSPLLVLSTIVRRSVLAAKSRNNQRLYNRDLNNAGYWTKTCHMTHRCGDLLFIKAIIVFKIE